MKKLYSLIASFSVALTFAQAPANYYNSANGLSGYALKTQLKNIISTGHIDRGYNAMFGASGLFTQSAFRDNYYENDGTLLDIYSENPNGGDPYNFSNISQQCGNYSNEGDCYNREHLVPQSYFDGFQTNPMRNDPFHVVPSDGKVNGERNNLAFGVVGTANYSSQNGSKRGNMTTSAFSAYNGVVFEPIDAFKGDVARAFLYFATRYETSMSNFYSEANANTCQAKAMFDGTNNKVFSDNFILLLIKWHKEDPVSAKEIAQNDAIYAYQGNRNPFIDNPAYVCQIWGTQCATVEALLSTPSFDFASVTVYPNPSNNHRINIDTEIVLDDIQLININGQLVQEIKNPSAQGNTYTIENLPSGFYFLKLTSDNQSTTKKVIIN